jgi:DNA adenine methylase
MQLKTTIQPVNPVAPWLGGKRNLAKRICAMIDADQHTTYAEPFVGMGGIFLRRTSCPRAEFINDAQRDVLNLFRILQEHYVAFLNLLRFQITTQANFNRLVGVDPGTLTDLQRAARFLYLQRCAFGGNVSGRNFGLATDRPGRFNLTTLESDLEALHSRLSGVTITCLDFAEFIRRIDRAGVLFYLDPPYWGSENDYGRNLFGRERFEEMAALLGSLKGRFILSLNDVPDVRQIFGQFDMEEVKTTYTIAARGAVPERAELIIRGGASN